MEFPSTGASMWVVPVRDVLAMTEIRPHEELTQKVLWTPGNDSKTGNHMEIIFVSHQWLGLRHPDPTFAQFAVLQETLQNLINSEALVIMCFYTARAFNKWFPELTRKRAKQLVDAYVWYDYFSIPQAASKEDFAAAVDAIPSFVERSRWFFVLAPFGGLPHEDGHRVDYTTWLSRGWCRLEQASQGLSRTHAMIHLIISSKLLEEKFPYNWVNACPRKGHLTVESDRERLDSIMGTTLELKLGWLEEGAKLGQWRFLRALAPLLGGVDQSGLEESAEGWLRWLRLPSTQAADDIGWTAIGYAALSGNSVIVEAVLDARADVHARTKRAYPEALATKGMTPLMIGARYVPDGERCQATLRALLRHGARHSDKDALQQTALHWATMGVESLVACKVLLEAGADTLVVDAIGQTPLQAAGNTCTMNYELIDFLTSEGHADPCKATANGMNMATQMCYGLTNQRAQRLRQAGISLDHQYFNAWRSPLVYGFLSSVRCLTGQPNLRLYLSMVGNTPLHECARLGLDEVSEALLANRADPSIRNRAGKTPLDLSREYGSEPLQELLDGSEFSL